MTVAASSTPTIEGGRYDEGELLALASVLFIYGELAPKPVSPPRAIPPSFPTGEFAAALTRINIKPRDPDAVAQRVARVWAQLHDGTADRPAMRLEDYDIVRSRVLETSDRKPAPGVLTWPVSTGNVRRTLGGPTGSWTDALATVGIDAGARGRTSGAVMWTDDALKEAWSAYAAHVHRAQNEPSIPDYAQWREKSDQPLPSIGTLMNRLGDGTWRKLRDQISPVPAAPLPAPATREVQAQQDLLALQAELVAQLQVRQTELDAEARVGAPGASDALASNTQLLTWAQLSYDTQKSTIEIETRRDERAAAEEKSRRRNDILLGVAVIVGTLAASALAPFLTLWIGAY